MSNLKVVFLGTGGSWPTPGRNLPAIAIKYGSEVILFDCGEGTQRQFMLSPLSFMQVSKIFITHFHGDHFLGLPGMIQSMSLNDRRRPLHIYGPAGVVELVNQILSLGHFTPGFDIVVHVVGDGTTIEFQNYSVHVIAVQHNVPAVGYVFEEAERRGKFYREKALALGVPEGPLFGRLQRGEAVRIKGRVVRPCDVMGPPRPGRKIVYSGDTLPMPAMVNIAKNADVLIHDSTLGSEHAEIAKEYGHTTANEAAAIAKRAHVGVLFLFHISPRYSDSAEALEKEAKSVFENSIVAEDLMEYEVRYQS